jgi:hypothetical protein
LHTENEKRTSGNYVENTTFYFWNEWNDAPAGNFESGGGCLDSEMIYSSLRVILLSNYAICLIIHAPTDSLKVLSKLTTNHLLFSVSFFPFSSEVFSTFNG